MKKETLFSYLIDGVMVEVSPLSMPLYYPMLNDWFYIGAAQAIAEYLCYPYDVIAPRVMRLPIMFNYDFCELEHVEMLCEEYGLECQHPSG